MIRHYVLTALVNMKASPFTTAAKVLTLALGLCAMIAACGIITYWRSADAAIMPAGGRAVLITTDMKDLEEGLEVRGIPVSTPTLARYIREDIPGVEQAVRFNTRGDIETDTGERKVVLQGANADAGFFDIFAFRFLAGDPKTALQSEDAIVLSREAAQRLFGGAPALGRTLVLGGARNVTVTGVYDDIPKPSHLGTGMFSQPFDYISVTAAGPPPADAWDSLSGMTYVLLPADGSLTRAELDRQLADLLDRRMPAEEKEGQEMTLRSASIGEVTEMSLNVMISTVTGGVFSFAAVLFVLGGVVLGVAGLNYANLAIAQAASRTREVGMRRVLGAGRLGILLQSWVEAGIATAAALVLTALLLWIASPIINAQAGIDLVGAVARDPTGLGWIAGIALLLSLLAGLYPAFVTSRVRPVEALRDGKARGGPRRVAAFLVGAQFVIASTLLIAMIVVNLQNAHMRRLTLDPAADPVVVLPPQSQSGVSIDTWRQQLAGRDEVVAVGEVIDEPWEFSGSYWELRRTPDDGASEQRAEGVDIGFGYFDALGQTLLAGRVHAPDRDTPAQRATPGQPRGERRVVIDETLSQKLGFASPQAAVGVQIFDGPAPIEIIGVVADRPTTLQNAAGGGTAYLLQARPDGSMPLVRLKSGEVDAGLRAIRGVWETSPIAGPFTFQFEDQLFETAFRSYAQAGRLFLGLSAVAFFISAMGLFGMAVHATQRRMHEIGVRKTLGSTARQVVTLLLTDFSKPVIIANLIAWPVGYLVAKVYLDTFANRIDLGPWPFILSFVTTLAIAWLSVGAQTVRAATIRPAEVLRNA